MDFLELTSLDIHVILETPYIDKNITEVGFVNDMPMPTATILVRIEDAAGKAAYVATSLDTKHGHDKNECCLYQPTTHS